MNKFSEFRFENDFARAAAENTPACPKCKDRGFYFEGDIAVACACKRPQFRNAKREQAGITPHLMKQTFEGFNPDLYSDQKRGKNKLTYRDNAEKIKGAAKAFCAELIAGENPSGLLFLGAVGSGKTYLAAAIANELVDHDQEVRFVVVPDFLDLIRESFQDDSPYHEGALMREVKAAPVLVLDDLGAHNYTDWSVKTIFAILNYRLNYELPTIVTTNLEQDRIEELLGSRVYSRLLEMCRFFRLENTKDIRMEQRIREARKS